MFEDLTNETEEIFTPLEVVNPTSVSCTTPRELYNEPNDVLCQEANLPIHKVRKWKEELSRWV